MQCVRAKHGDRLQDVIFGGTFACLRPIETTGLFCLGDDRFGQLGSGTPSQIVERVGSLLEDGMADYICFMFPTGDMSYDEAQRTLELFVTDVMPELEPSIAASS